MLPQAKEGAGTHILNVATTHPVPNTTFTKAGQAQKHRLYQEAVQYQACGPHRRPRLSHRLGWKGTQGLGQALVHLLGSVLQVPATACH